jgi:hypothetical protein
MIVLKTPKILAAYVTGTGTGLMIFLIPTSPMALNRARFAKEIVVFRSQIYRTFHNYLKRNYQ